MSDPRADAARYRAERDGESEEQHTGPPQWTTREERISAVEASIQTAMRRGEFDNLPGAGKPIDGLDGGHDPDWWIRRKIERENLTGLAPPAIQLRNEHRAMEATLDEFSREEDVRAHLEEFNRRVKRARMQLEGGPPVVTPLHDVDDDLRAWRDRRAARRERVTEEQRPSAVPRRGWRRRWLGGAR